MDDAKLQKIILPPDVIDLSYGEPVAVTKAMFAQINRAGSSFRMPSMYALPNWTYQPASGNPEFVSFLEKKYGARVVVTNGAKQALAAALFAFKKSGINTVYYDVPYYPPNPQLIQASGLRRVSGPEYAESILLTSPNNPDGRNLTNDTMLDIASQKPTIHDGAYYNEIYLPSGQKPTSIGNIQIFSMSKMYGLSGLRIGYAVCHDDKFYRDVCSYIESTTAGTSIASQTIAFSVEQYFASNPAFLEEFQREARETIIASRAELTKIDPDVLSIEPTDSASMFAWCKAGPALDHKSAKVHLFPGELFGKPGMVRLNIAHSPHIIKTAVERLNNNKIKIFDGDKS